ncbi:MAG TPA: hypothetical protein VJB93_03940, partial [Patescibacteria group bacterium]|nr:hypothetical protein [Patescibacteria group bacterium]
MKLSSFYRALIFTIILLSTPSPIFSAQQSGEKIRPGDIVKHTSSFAVYKINEDGTKSVFPHESVFKSYGYADFNGIKTTDLSRTPSTAPVAFRDGTLLRAQKKNIFGQDTTTVFVVEKGELRPIVSADVYQSLYHDPQWERVVWIPNDLISKFNYSIGNTWVDPSTPPMGTVIKTNTGYYIIDKEDSTYIKRKLEPRAVTANRISAMPIV